MGNPFEAWLLHSQCEAYGKLPSELLGLETPWGAWQVNQAVFMVGRKYDKAIADGKNPFNAAKNDSSARQKPPQRQFLDPRKVKRPKKVKIKADGTW